MSDTLADLVVRLSADFGDVSSQIGNLGNQLDSLKGTSEEVANEFKALGDQLDLFGDQLAIPVEDTTGQLELFPSILEEVSSSADDAGEKSSLFGDILNSLGIAAAGAIEFLQNLGGAEDEAGASASNASEGTGELLSNLLELGGITLGLVGLKEAATEAFEAFAHEERATEALTALTGSSKTAEEMIVNLKAQAMHLGLPIEETIQAAQRMTAFGFSLDKIPPLIEATANASRAMNKDFGSLAQMIERVAMSGMANNRFLAQMGLSTELLGKAMGIMGSQVQKAFRDMSQEQRIDVMLTALDKFKGLAASTADDLTGSWQKMKDQSELVFESFGSAMSTFAKDFLGSVGEIIRSIGDIGKGVGSLVEYLNHVPEAMEAAKVFILASLTAIAPELVILGVTAAKLMDLINALHAEQDAQKLTSEAEDQTADSLGKMHNKVQDLAKAYPEVIAKLEAFRDQYEKGQITAVGYANRMVQIKESLIALHPELVKTATAISLAAAKAEGTASTMKSLHEGVTRAADALVKADAAFKAGTGSEEDLQKATKGLTEAQSALEAATQKSTAAQTELITATTAHQVALLNAERTGIEARKTLRNASDAETTAALIDLNNTEMAIEISGLTKRMALEADAPAKQERLKAQVQAVKDKWAAKNQELTNKQLESDQKFVDKWQDYKEKYGHILSDMNAETHGYISTMLGIDPTIDKVLEAEKKLEDEVKKQQKTFDKSMMKWDETNAIAAKMVPITVDITDRLTKMGTEGSAALAKILGAEQKLGVGGKDTGEELVAAFSELSQFSSTVGFAKIAEAAERVSSIVSKLARTDLPAAIEAQKALVAGLQNTEGATGLLNIEQEKLLEMQIKLAAESGKDATTEAIALTNLQAKTQALKEVSTGVGEIYAGLLKDFEGTFDALGRGITDGIMKTEKWAEVWKKFAKDVGTELISTLINGALKLVVAGIMAQLPALAVVTAAHTTAASTAAASETAITAAMRISEVTGEAGVAAASAFAAYAGIPFVGEALGAAAATSAFAAVMAFLPAAAAEGGFDVGNVAPITQLHPKEMVLPSYISEGLRGMIRGQSPSAMTAATGQAGSNGLTLNNPHFHGYSVQDADGLMNAVFKAARRVGLKA